MSNPIRKLAGQTALYGVSTIVGRVLNYLLVPLYTYQFSRPDEFGNEGKNVLSTAQPTQRSVTADEAALIGRGTFPSAELRRIVTPAGETGTYRINLAQANESSRLHPYTLIWVDRWSGQIREVRNPKQFSAGARFIAGIWPLHSAESSGTLVRLIWFIAGLAPLVLFVSGTLHYLIGRKIIRDRTINFARIQRYLRNFGRSLITAGRRLLHWSKPYATKLTKWVLSKLS